MTQLAIEIIGRPWPCPHCVSKGPIDSRPHCVSKGPIDSRPHCVRPPYYKGLKVGLTTHRSIEPKILWASAHSFYRHVPKSLKGPRLNEMKANLPEHILSSLAEASARGAQVQSGQALVGKHGRKDMPNPTGVRQALVPDRPTLA
jgi:hypothetical protein